MADDAARFVIIGASLAGAKAAEALRAEGFDGSIVLVGSEADLPYERPPLSKGYLLGTEDRAKAFVHDAAWYEANDIDLRLGVTATALDPGSRTVTLTDGTVDYDKLLLATGSRVRRLDLPGGDLAGVHYLRTVGDSDALRAAFTPGAAVVVVGAGWIGLETAAAAITHGCSVTVVEADALPLRRVLGDEVAHIYADLHRGKGVHFRFGAGVAAFGSHSGSRVDHVMLADGESIPADVVVVGVGIVPNVELASAAGLAVDNGVVTDEHLQTSDPAVYAAGDVASFFSPLVGRHIRVEHWSNALNGGRAAGLSMLGHGAPFDRVPYFYSDQYELGMEYAGFVPPAGYDSVVFRGSAPEFLAFWVKDGRVLAGMNVNIWDVQDEIQRLVRLGWADGQAVDLSALADPSVPLSTL